MNRISLISPARLMALFAGITSLVMVSSLEAQTRVGILNMQKVFDGYWKTRQASAQLDTDTNEYKKQEKEFLETYEKTNEEYRKLVDGASDQAVTPEERDKRKKAAEEKFREIQKIEEQLKTFGRQARTTLEERLLRMREGVLREIMEVVSAKSKAAGYSIVIDTAAQSRNATLIFLYNNGENDLTQVVLAELNKNAPAEWLKPAEEKSTTNLPDPKLTPPTTKPEKKPSKK